VSGEIVVVRLVGGPAPGDRVFTLGTMAWLTWPLPDKLPPPDGISEGCYVKHRQADRKTDKIRGVEYHWDGNRPYSLTLVVDDTRADEIALDVLGEPDA